MTKEPTHVIRKEKNLLEARHRFHLGVLVHNVFRLDDKNLLVQE